METAIYNAGGIRESNLGNLNKIAWARSSRTDKGVMNLTYNQFLFVLGNLIVCYSILRTFGFHLCCGEIDVVGSLFSDDDIIENGNPRECMGRRPFWHGSCESH